MTGDGFARLALGMGAVAVRLRTLTDLGALAWPVTLLGIGLWLAAVAEHRTRPGNLVSNTVLWGGAGALALARVLTLALPA